MKILYTAEATAKGGREGKIRSSDGVLEHSLAIPKEMGGPGGAATNPEQLFAAGYAACFEGAVRFVARTQKIAFQDLSVTGRVGIGQAPSGVGFALEVELAPKFTGISQSAAEELVKAAHQVCPYSNATRGNIDVKLSVSVS